MNGIRVQNYLVFVLVLGLMACTPDKPQKREDQWRFSPPEIVIPGAGDDRGRLKVGEASQRELSMESRLSFPNMSEDVILEIDSICTIGSKNFEENFQLMAPSELAFVSIVPSRALLMAATSSLECSFDFSAVNQHGSRHHFLIPGVKFASANDFGSLVVSKKLQQISPRNDSATLTTVAVDELDELAVDGNTASGVAELACLDFTSRESYKSVDTINWKQLAYKQPIEVLEKVLSKFLQPCRLALIDSRGVRAEISTSFILRYPPPALDISTSVDAYDQPKLSFTTQMPILKLNLSNPTNIDQYFSLAMPTVGMKQVWTPGGFNRDKIDNGYYFWRAMDPTAHISYEVSGAEFNVVSEKVQFVIKAKSAVTITAVANSVFRYLSSGGALHAGYLFLFDSPLRLERLETSGEVSEGIPIFTKLAHNFVETQVYIPTTTVKGDWSYISRNLTERPRPADGD